jgi:hypothetical protein
MNDTNKWFFRKLTSDNGKKGLEGGSRGREMTVTGAIQAGNATK